MENGNKTCFDGDETPLTVSPRIESVGVHLNDTLENSRGDNGDNSDVHPCNTNNGTAAHNFEESAVHIDNGPEVVAAAEEENDEARVDADELEESDEDSDDNLATLKNLPSASIFRIDFNRLQSMWDESFDDADAVKNGSSDLVNSGEAEVLVLANGSSIPWISYEAAALRNSYSDRDISDSAANESSDSESPSADEVGISGSQEIRGINMNLTPTRQAVKKLADVLWISHDYNCYCRRLEDKELFICARLYTGPNKILSYFNLRHSETQYYDVIIFLPVLNEQKELQAIYAATGGRSSWRHIQLLCDQAFSSEISPKILHSEGATCHNVSCVVGIYRSKKSIFKDTVNLSNLELGEVCKKFTAAVDNSIRNEEDVTRKDLLFPDFLNRKFIKSDVAEFSIKFHIDLNICQLFHLVEKLELIYVDPTDKYCIQDSKLQRIVLKVSEEVANVLKKEVNENISSFVNSHLNIVEAERGYLRIEDTEFSELGEFDVSFKRERQFTEATNFKVKYNKSRLVEIEDNPSFVQVLQKAVELYQTESTEAQEAFDFEKN